MKKASKRRILFAARMATMVGAACFAVSGISETLGQEKEKSRPVYIATEEVAETTYTPEVEEATQPTETAKAVETEEPLIASMDWDKDDSYLLCKIAMAEAESEGVKGKALVMLVVLKPMNEELKEIVEGYRTEGIHISDEEVNEILWLCNRKMEISKIEDREEYLPLLFKDEVKNYLFRRGVNAVTLLRSLEAKGICVQYAE